MMSSRMTPLKMREPTPRTEQQPSDGLQCHHIETNLRRLRSKCVQSFTQIQMEQAGPKFWLSLGLVRHNSQRLMKQRVWWVPG